MVGEQANLGEVEIRKDLRADAGLVLRAALMVERARLAEITAVKTSAARPSGNFSTL